MAKIKYSALVSEMRNKLNGSVLSKNRYGNYIRNKVTPVNPQTSFQQNVRALLSSVSQAWAGLSEAGRNGFTALAQNHPFTDIFGDSKTLDGKAMFSKLNMNLQKIGLSPITVAPVFVGMPFIEIISVTPSVSAGLQIQINEAVIPAGFTAVVDATPALPATINFVKNRYRQVGTGTAVANEIDASLAYDARFGALASGDIGKVVHVRLSLVSNTTGQVSIASEGSAVVTNAPA